MDWERGGANPGNTQKTTQQHLTPSAKQSKSFLLQQIPTPNIPTGIWAVGENFWE